jgi:hypothetical protein
VIVDSTSPWALPKDIRDAVKEDVGLHGDFEIRTAAFSIKSPQLASVLRERQLAHASSGVPGVVASALDASSSAPDELA